jgi:predicted nucleic acid-binding protein
MPKPRVYVETTIPNFYYEFRDSPAVVERREITRAWWADAGQRYDLLTSSTTLAELAAGTRHHLVRLRMELLNGLPVVFADPLIRAVVNDYLRHKLMPSKPTTADASHLALASYHKCDFLVTWDSHHLANPNKVPHIQRVNAALGLHVPVIVTPAELLRRTDE